MENENVELLAEHRDRILARSLNGVLPQRVDYVPREFFLVLACNPQVSADQLQNARLAYQFIQAKRIDIGLVAALVQGFLTCDDAEASEVSGPRRSGRSRSASSPYNLTNWSRSTSFRYRGTPRRMYC